MKKTLTLIISIIAVLAMSAVVNAEEKENEAFKFRGFEWGTPLEEIKAKEITDGMIEGFNYEYREAENAFILMTTVANVNLFAWFFFDDDLKLNYGFYTPYTTLIKTDIEYYSDYETIDNALIKLYGEPERFATGVDVDDIADMNRDEIISKVVQENAVILHKWVANDGSEIYSNCCFLGGHVRGEFYYVQSEEQFQELVALDEASYTDGL